MKDDVYLHLARVGDMELAVYQKQEIQAFLYGTPSTNGKLTKTKKV